MKCCNVMELPCNDDLFLLPMGDATLAFGVSSPSLSPAPQH
jgi:hypothetical protein